MIDLYTLSVIIFFLILATLIYLDRRNIEFKYILFIRRTKKGLKLIGKISKFRNFWKIFGIAAIITCFFVSINGLINLARISQLILEGKIKGFPGGFVFPWPSPEPKVGVGYILVPFWFWVIIIATILIPHEIMHGIMCKVEKIRVKSVGFILFLIFPGAFVEPDEKKLKNAKLLSKLKIFAVGSFVNILFAFILFNPFLKVGIIQNIIWPMLTPGYLEIAEVNSTGPAAAAGLKPGMIITKINGMPIKITYFDMLSGKYFDELQKVIENKEEIEVIANGSKYFVKVGKKIENNKTQPFLGIKMKISLNTSPSTFSFVILLFTWMWILNYGVGVFNILPIYPLDGGLMLHAILERITKKYCKKITVFITAITLFLLFFTIFGPAIVT